jgi:hypothetical protein
MMVEFNLKMVSLLQPPPAPTLNGTKRPRTAEDFLLFCKFILDYENYEMLRQAEVSEVLNEIRGDEVTTFFIIL